MLEVAQKGLVKIAKKTINNNFLLKYAWIIQNTVLQIIRITKIKAGQQKPISIRLFMIVSLK